MSSTYEATFSVDCTRFKRKYVTLDEQTAAFQAGMEAFALRMCDLGYLHPDALGNDGEPLSSLYENLELDDVTDTASGEYKDKSAQPIIEYLNNKL